MAGPVTVACPICGVAFTVPTEVVGIDKARNLVLTKMDRSNLYGHLQACAAAHPTHGLEHRSAELEKLQPPVKGPKVTIPDAERIGRVEQMLAGGHYVATAGSRACTMCGTTGDDCITETRKGRVPCCAACGVGNTHPAPREHMTCAEWGAEHGAKA